MKYDINHRQQIMEPPTRGLTMKKRIWLAVVASSIVPGLVDRAVAQPISALTTTQITGPALANLGDHLIVCMNFSKVNFRYTSQVQMQILNSVTGAVLTQKQFTVQPAGSTALPPDPCLEYVIPAAVTTSTIGSEAAAPAVRPIYIGLVSLNPQPLPPDTAVSSQPLPPGTVISSLHVFTPGLFGVPTNIRYIPPVVTCPPGEEPCVY
jgi:hypothetical protein